MNSKPKNKTQETLDSKTLLDVTQTKTWRWGIPLLIVAVFAGIGVGVVASKATSAPPVDYRYPVCDNCSKAKTHARADGVDKFKDGKFGKAVRRIDYRHSFKEIASKKLANKINAASKRTAATIMGTSVAVQRRNETTPDEAWEVFTGQDTCLAAGTLYFMEDDPQQKEFYGTCEGGALMWDTVQQGLTDDDIAAFICGGMLAIGAKATEEAGAGPWAWAAVGAGGAGCFWGAMID